ncbi:MAG: hypothetical protein J0H42_04370 [Rhizobiales bacterium]|nr:hypothetical protein [Hyphomicrobiales bacterium]
MVNGRFTEAWLQGAIVMICQVILEHGEQYAPVLDRLERELAELKRHDDPLNRARRHLERAQASDSANPSRQGL